MYMRFMVFCALGLVAGCSLNAPPPMPEITPSAAETTRPAAVAGSGTGLAPTPPAVLEDTSGAPSTPVNFVAMDPIPMALIWYGRTDLDTVPTILSKTGTASRFTFAIDKLNIDCQGLLRFEGESGAGTWELFCSDTSQAAGILVPVAGQAAINGQGVDEINRSVIFSIPVYN